MLHRVFGNLRYEIMYMNKNVENMENSKAVATYNFVL